MSAKPRPDNGPGSNGLRGGLNTYSVKTTTGNWLEDYGGPGGYKRGFTSPDFETESQHAQLGVTLKPAPEFGAEIPVLKYEEKQDIPDRWTTTSMTMTSSIAKRDKIAEPPKELVAQIEKYRNTWTTDSEIDRKIRFQTESRLAGNVASEKFRTQSVRVLPGTPKALENLREKLVERFGVLAISVLKYSMGGTAIATKDFKSIIDKTGVTLKPYEYNQVLAFTTPSSSTLSTEQLIYALRGRIEGYETKPVAVVYNKVTNDGNNCTVEEFINSMQAEESPEIVDYLKAIIPLYSSDGVTLSKADFNSLHYDIYSSSPLDFSAVLKSLW